MAGLVSDGAVTVDGLCNGIAVKSERKKELEGMITLSF